MSDTRHQARKILKYDGKGKKSSEMCVMKYKAWLHNIWGVAVLNNGFDLTLSATEGKVLDITDTGDKAEDEALTQKLQGNRRPDFGVQNSQQLWIMLPKNRQKTPIGQIGNSPKNRAWIRANENPADTMAEWS